MIRACFCKKMHIASYTSLHNRTDGRSHAEHPSSPVVEAPTRRRLPLPLRARDVCGLGSPICSAWVYSLLRIGSDASIKRSDVISPVGALIVTYLMDCQTTSSEALTLRRNTCRSTP